MLNWFVTHFLIAGRAYSWRLRLQRIAHSFPLPRSNLPSLHTGSKSRIYIIALNYVLLILTEQPSLAGAEPGEVWIQTSNPCYIEMSNN